MTTLLGNRASSVVSFGTCNPLKLLAEESRPKVLRYAPKSCRHWVCRDFDPNFSRTLHNQSNRVFLFRCDVGKYFPNGRTAMAQTLIGVQANAQVTQTSIILASGEKAGLIISGTWAIWGANDPRISYAAGGYAIAAGNWPAPGQVEGCLLINVGGRVTAVTEAQRTSQDGVYSLVIEGPGNIEFGPNDNNCSDNRGQMSVSITWPIGNAPSIMLEYPKKP